MKASEVAVIAYGVLANAAALALAAMTGSLLGALLVFASSGLTYIYQVAVLLGGEPELDGFVDTDGPLMNTIWAIIVVTLLASVTISIYVGL